MPAALMSLIGFELIGEVLRRALHLPLPGPVIGMFLLAAVLLRRRPAQDSRNANKPSDLQRAADTLISNMGLLFVPAGVGIMAEGDLLRHEWLPIIAGVVGSTVLSLIVTALVMHHIVRIAARRQANRAEASATSGSAALACS